jgi:hypothetical protein
MSDIDEKKPSGKAGKRKRNADQRSRKADHKQPPKAEQVQSATVQIDALAVAAPDPAQIKTTAAEALASPAITGPGPTTPDVQADPAVAMKKPMPVVAPDIAETPAVVIRTSDAAPVAATVVEPQPDVKLVTADTLPIVAPDVSEPPAAVMTAVEAAPTPAPDTMQQVASAAPPALQDAPPSPIAATPVSLQTIAEAYGEFTRKSLEQTKCFLDKLTAVRSLDQAVEIQTEFARKACETFVAEAQKISELHRELARQRFERLGGFMPMGTQSSRWM